jgi:hypothetical protein
MGSLIEELKRREAAARAEADRLRSRIEELAEDLARADEQVSRLVIAREEVARVLEEPAVEPSAGRDGKPAREQRPASPIGAVTVPPWQEGPAASVLPQAYQDLLEVAADAGRPLRAGEFAAAAGLARGQGEVEGLRSKLRLLAARGWLAGVPGGLFMLPDHTGVDGVLRCLLHVEPVSRAPPHQYLPAAVGHEQVQEPEHLEESHQDAHGGRREAAAVLRALGLGETGRQMTRTAGAV